MCQAEDAEDVQAAAVASEEAGAELAEFDENIPWDEREAELKKQQAEKTSKVWNIIITFTWVFCLSFLRGIAQVSKTVKFLTAL